MGACHFWLQFILHCCFDGLLCGHWAGRMQHEEEVKPTQLSTSVCKRACEKNCHLRYFMFHHPATLSPIMGKSTPARPRSRAIALKLVHIWSERAATATESRIGMPTNESQRKRPISNKQCLISNCHSRCEAEDVHLISKTPSLPKVYIVKNT